MSTQYRFPDHVAMLLDRQVITRDQASRMLHNYEFFESRRQELKRKYPWQWVAALDEQIFTDRSLPGLRAVLEDKEHAESAYVEQVTAE